MLIAFTETTVWNAFFLNSIINAFIITFVFILELHIMDKNTSSESESRRHIFEKNLIRNGFLFLIGSFFISIVIYSVMYLIFGYGEGMII